MKPHKITVFTPTYNRAYILDRVYKSLINQTNKSFVWLIVDDGSTDNTESLVKKWIKEDKIEIKYYKQKNGGKQRAHNKAVKLTDTDLFICLDSDDYFTKDAIEILLNSWNEVV
jgi:glycosyltransferase involved in cell wall biosynthesis